MLTSICCLQANSHSGAGLTDVFYQGIRKQSRSKGEGSVVHGSAAASIPAKPPGWPESDWCSRNGKSQLGCTHMQIVAAYIHEAATRQYRLFTKQQWAEVSG
jgi:hypothetical protein